MPPGPATHDGSLHNRFREADVAPGHRHGPGGGAETRGSHPLFAYHGSLDSTWAELRFCADPLALAFCIALIESLCSRIAQLIGDHARVARLGCARAIFRDDCEARTGDTCNGIRAADRAAVGLAITKNQSVRRHVGVRNGSGAIGELDRALPKIGCIHLSIQRRLELLQTPLKLQSISRGEPLANKCRPDISGSRTQGGVARNAMKRTNENCFVSRVAISSESAPARYDRK